MIAFDFNWSEPLNLVLILFLILLGSGQIWLLLRSSGPDISKQKMGIRIALNLLLWLTVAGFVLQPIFRSIVLSGKVMIAGKDVPSKEIKRIQDSLHIREVFSEGNLKGKSFDTLTLVGQDFSPAFFSDLSQQITTSVIINRIPYFSDHVIQSISWNGIIRKGQVQRIIGSVNSSDAQWAKVKFGNQTLDSVKLEKGNQTFDLSFPVFTEKRTKVDLYLGDDHQETIQFFARPLPPLTFQIILDNPDFESRSLATWLGNRGNSVEISTNLSKDIRSKLTLNKTGTPDVIITDPKNASNAEVKKALATGKSILFINLSNGSSDITSINSALGTKFQIKKISNEEALPVIGELSKLPFDFGKSNGYMTVSKYPVAVEKTTGKVAVSLLNETFPTLLNGDSISYGNIWTSVIAAIHPAYQSNVEVNSPVYKGFKTDLKFNNLINNPVSMVLGADTLHLNYSAINKQSADVSFIPSESSWLKLSDDSEINITDSLDFNDYYKSKIVDQFVKSRLQLQVELNDVVKVSDQALQHLNESRIPDWIWFLTFVLCFSALWLEPKFN
ncbi:hypothetical protein [Dyadobacter frigoris]|uniref:Aerotolerance regulator N-terminal domain-containing protein n=1 Tax=Dyadobacter frigoris TaxID=2576211 RepID=A0A4U6CWY0_9BACT|nr:hypothetical protein [Dyadobacter frigoris]TKT88167.1 hypothetical protein FDK13_27730 [Dyadobacter frigoris]GLU53783.1 hypothetical protein Dfri01_32440 [Dyadobacter frigoris]